GVGDGGGGWAWGEGGRGAVPRARKQIARAVTRRTRAVLAVHFGGLPCAMRDLAEVARRRKLVIVEDASHALGARYQARMVGGLGNLAVCALHLSVPPAAPAGGAVATADPALAARLRRLRPLAFSPAAVRRAGGHERP